MKMKVALALLLGVALSQSPACPGSASARKPSMTYCMCPRNKYLKVKKIGNKIGYYCQQRARRAGRCSLSARHLTFRKCICHRPFAKASKTINQKLRNGRTRRRTGYYCKRAHNYRDCPESAYCLFNPAGMTSRQYNTQVRACNRNMDQSFASIQKESSQYCVCGSAAWKRAHPGHQKFYLRYTYHRTVVNGRNVYKRGYVCMPRFIRKKKKCKANVSRGNPSTFLCQCNKGERRMSTVRRMGRRRKRVYWCQRVAPCDTTNADAVSSVFCSCPKNEHETLRYVRGACHRKKTNYHPVGCNMKYKGYRIGFCFDDNRRTRDRRRGNRNRKNRNRNRRNNQRGGRRRVVRRRGGRHPRRLAAKRTCKYGRRTYRQNQTRRRGRTTYKCNNGKWVRNGGRSCRYRRRTYRNTASRRQGRTTYKCMNGKWRRITCTYGRRTYRQGQARRQNGRDLVCRGGKWVNNNRHKRAREHQCCKRITCLNREVGYYCYKRNNCATASITRPSRTFCHCPRGTHLKYTQRYRGYYCQHLHHCSMKSSTPTQGQCTCRAGYNKRHQRARRLSNGHYQRPGFYCAKRTRACPSYNRSRPNRGSRSYNCGCRRGTTVHYYRYHNVFYKTCVRHRTISRPRA